MNKVKSTHKSDGTRSAPSSAGRIQSKSGSTGDKKKDLKNQKGILVEAARKIETGAKVIGEKAADVVEKVTDQTSEVADLVYDKVKKGVSEAYSAGSRTISDVGKKAAKYIKKYDNTLEMQRLSNDRQNRMHELGTYFFTMYKSKSQDIKVILSSGEAQKMIYELESLNKEIVKLGREIKKKI